MAKEVLHVFKVQQSKSSIFYLNFPYLNFPVDMLRRDHCYPANEADSVNIAFSFNLKHSEGFVGEINLCRYAHKNWVPNKDRWMSFGWEVIAEGHLC